MNNYTEGYFNDPARLLNEVGRIKLTQEMLGRVDERMASSVGSHFPSSFVTDSINNNFFDLTMPPLWSTTLLGENLRAFQGHAAVTSDSFAHGGLLGHHLDTDNRMSQQLQQLHSLLSPHSGISNNALRSPHTSGIADDLHHLEAAEGIAFSRIVAAQASNPTLDIVETRSQAQTLNAFRSRIDPILPEVPDPGTLTNPILAPIATADVGDADPFGGNVFNPSPIEPFPEKLHRILLETESIGVSHVISFTLRGKAFKIHKEDIFAADIIPLYFNQSKISSFKRQLNLYGFKHISCGPFKGSYWHPEFRKDRPDLLRNIKRNDPQYQTSSMPFEPTAPDFYSMPPILSLKEAKATKEGVRAKKKKNRTKTIAKVQAEV